MATLRGTSRDTGLDMNKLVEAAAHFRGVAQKLNIDPKVLKVDVNTLLYQVPGGMLSNLISQLKQANAEDKYYDVLEEIPRVRKDFGYPPLVTPTSQIVGSQAVLNVLAGERYKMITKESKGLLRGEYGQLPGEVNEEVRKKAIGNDEVITCRPADLLEPEMDKLRAECKEKGLGHCEEDVPQLRIVPPGGPEVPGVARRPSHRGSPRCRPQGRGQQRPPHPHRRGPDRRRVLKQHRTAFGRAPGALPFALQENRKTAPPCVHCARVLSSGQRRDAPCGTNRLQTACPGKRASPPWGRSPRL